MSLINSTVRLLVGGCLMLGIALSCSKSWAGLVTGGVNFTIVVRQDGTVWARGANQSGQLGNNTQMSSENWVQVTGLGDISSVSAGADFALALGNSGTVWAWGNNNKGQLGDGTTTSRLTPVAVSGLSGVTAISAGSTHAMALKSDGTVWSWGDNAYGQLGDNSTTRRLTPVQANGLTAVSAVSAGNWFSLALQSSGTVWGWGFNNSGQLGNGSGSQKLVPTSSSLNNAVSIAAGQNFALVVKADGTLYQMGRIVGFPPNYSPVLVSGINNAKQAVLKPNQGGAYDASYLLLKQDGTVWAWGDNSYGQLGNGSQTNNNTPVQIPGLNNIVEIATGMSFALAVRNDGLIFGWGRNLEGELLNPMYLSGNIRGLQIPGISNVAKAAVGLGHNLAIDQYGYLWAWGKNDAGQLGNGTTVSNPYPAKVAMFENSGFTAVAAEMNGSFAAMEGGQVYFFGVNQIWNTKFPSCVFDLSNYGLQAEQISINEGTGTVLDNAGQIWMFGQISAGGYLSDDSLWQPDQLLQIDGIDDVALVCNVNWQNALALRNDGTVWNVGSNGYYNEGRYYPNVTLGSSSWTAVTGVSSGMSTQYVLKSDGSVWGWGNNSMGQLGLDPVSSGWVSQARQITGLSDVVKIGAAMAVKRDGSVWMIQKNGPVQVPGLSGIVDIATLDGWWNHGLAIKADGSLAGWGINTYNEYGIGNDRMLCLSPVTIFDISGAADAQVQIQNPADGSAYRLGKTVGLSVSVSGGAQPIQSVDYYYAGMKIGSSTTAPQFNWNWQPDAWGEYPITAVAEDARGMEAFSTPVTVKILDTFDSDGNGIPDWWEKQYFGQTGLNPNAQTPAGNGLTYLQAYQQELDPNDYYDQPGGYVLPIIRMVSGNSQSGNPGTFAGEPLTVRVTDSETGLPLANAPVRFMVFSGDLLSSYNSPLAQRSSVLNLRTDASGQVSNLQSKLYVWLPDTGDQQQIQIYAELPEMETAGLDLPFFVTFNLRNYLLPGDDVYRAEFSSMTATIEGDQVLIEWSGDFNLVQGFDIQRSDDGGQTWSLVAAANEVDCNITLIGDQVGIVDSLFRVLANGTGGASTASPPAAKKINPDNDPEADYDGDGVKNKDDGWPRSREITDQKPLGHPQYAMIDLGEGQAGVSLNNNGMVLDGQGNLWNPQTGQWGQHPNFPLSASGTFVKAVKINDRNDLLTQWLTVIPRTSGTDAPTFTATVCYLNQDKLNNSSSHISVLSRTYHDDYAQNTLIYCLNNNGLMGGELQCWAGDEPGDYITIWTAPGSKYEPVMPDRFGGIGVSTPPKERGAVYEMNDNGNSLGLYWNYWAYKSWIPGNTELPLIFYRDVLGNVTRLPGLDGFLDQGGWYNGPGTAALSNGLQFSLNNREWVALSAVNIFNTDKNVCYLWHPQNGLVDLRVLISPKLQVGKLNDRLEILAGDEINGALQPGIVRDGKFFAYKDILNKDVGWQVMQNVDLNNSGEILAYAKQTKYPNGRDIPAGQQKIHTVLLVPMEMVNLADPAKDHNNQDTVIEFKQSGTDPNIKCVAWIAAHDPQNGNAPRMPKLQVQAASVPGWTYYWKLQVVFHDRHGNPHRDFDTGDPYDSDSTPLAQDNVMIPAATGSGESSDPDQGWKQSPDGSLWKIYDDPDWKAAIHEGFFGGDAVLSLKIKDGNGHEIMPQQDFKFRIAGENPDDSKCREYICNQYGGPGIPARDVNNKNAWKGFWFAYAIAKEETAYEGGGDYYNQFLDKGVKARKQQEGESYAHYIATRYDAGKGKEGCPNWNNDGTSANRPTGTGGYGLFQHTYESGETNYLMPREWIWNWQKNVDGVQAKLNEKYNKANQVYGILRQKYPALGDIPNHLSFSGLESLVITFYNGAGGEMTAPIPGTTRKTCWWGEDVSTWLFLQNQNKYVDKVNGYLGN